MTKHQHPTARLSPAKLVDFSEGYRVAAEALDIVSEHGCSDESYARICDMLIREARTAQSREPA